MNRRTRRIQRDARRGVLLLVILGLLAMFALVAVAFVVITSQAQRAAKQTQRVDEQYDPPEETLHQAALQLFRGSTSPGSALGPHSLLEDMYGQDLVEGAIAAGNGADLVAIAGGQLVELTPSFANAHRRIGCVLTFLDGPAEGESTRIVGLTTGGKIQIVGLKSTKVSDLHDFLVSNQINYVVNGTPFSGLGFGYDTGNGNLEATVSINGTDCPVALLPGADDNDDPDGGANEDYDAVDFQNMALGAQIPDGSGGVYTIPSFHRPALVQYWMKEVGGLSSFDRSDWTSFCNSNPQLARAICLRPNGYDHSDFYTNVNPDFNPAWDGVTAGGGQWDVDNDGDGVADGIWLDLGLPVRSTADGRLYKPLVSFLCVDLDGRLNLNAHGNLDQADPKDSTGVIGGTPYYYDEVDIGSTYLFADSKSTANLPRGQGYGPAEINLGPLFWSTATPTSTDVSNYQTLLNGNGTLDGRYVGSNPGAAGVDDPLSQNKWFDYGGNYWSFSGAGYIPDTYGTPPDLDGNCAVGLDIAGRPLYWGMGEATADDPYELDLSRGRTRGLSSPSTAPDNPFSVNELERLLRPFDRDATSLADRLWELTGGTSTTLSTLHPHRNEITTESWSVPCPSVALPPEVRTAFDSGNPAKHFGDLLTAKGVDSDQWAELLPPELLAGLKMNVNRPFGNGVDDASDTDTVVDNIGEETSGEQITQIVKPDGTTASADMDHDNDGTSGAASPDAARQLHARHLYVMMLLLMNYDTADADVARQVAQWAVNMVDFRDRDSIMTPFEYDTDPFNDNDTPSDDNPWDVDGIVNDAASLPPGSDDNKWYRGLVWGCERPELLISETLAFHDRRTEDLSTDPTGKKTTDDPINNPRDCDDDFDQRWMPEGSLFIELFNPWTSMEPPSGELHETTYRGVDLTKADGGSPCWRLVIVDGTDTGDPDDPDPANLPTSERSVYFVDATAAGVTLPADDTSNVIFHPSDTMAAKIAPILPGRYMVIGPGDKDAAGTCTTHIGFQTGHDPSNIGSSSRRIELSPNSNPTTAGQVQVIADGSNNDLASVSIQNAVAAVINSPRRLSISEPDNGYDWADYDVAAGGYATPYDAPQDKARGTMWDAANVQLKDNGRFDDVKIVYLQRLANPLLAYDKDTNPYRTIDSMPIDLMSFNGVTNEPDDQEVPPAPGSTDEGNETTLNEFYSRERGENNDATNPNNLWTSEPLGNSPKANTNNIPPTVTNYYCNHSLNHTLGYLNDDFGLPRSTANYVGEPEYPFPWLTWNNRPFVSELELTLVPKQQSSQLLPTYGIPATGVDGYTNADSPFPHMTNFLYDSIAETTSPNWKLYRLLDYLHVPSRFVGTEIQVNPANCVSGDHWFHPPFNHISTYREPGRINLNTIFSRNVFQGLMNDLSGALNMNTLNFWEKFVVSRQDYGTYSGGLSEAAISTAMMDVNSSWPTRFGCPFRSAASGDLVPLTSMEPTNVIDVTLLRPDPSSATDPLFGYESTGTFPTAVPDDTQRNPFFRYQALQRLGNLVTTRSNVYAVWMTVGYFEVSPVTVDAAHPDGYELQQELGSDTGDIQRHRAFYIFDRSIPVGFERGKDLNVDDAILLHRMIE